MVMVYITALDLFPSYEQNFLAIKTFSSFKFFHSNIVIKRGRKIFLGGKHFLAWKKSFLCFCSRAKPPRIFLNLLYLEYF